MFTLRRWNLMISPTSASGSDWRIGANNMHFSLSNGLVSESSTMLTNMLKSADKNITWNIHNCFMALWDYPGEPVPEETLTHPPSWSSSNLYQLLPSTMIHSVGLFKLRVWPSFCTTSLHVLFGHLLVWSPPPHIPYISSPNQCLLFATHVNTIANCFAVVSILYHLFLVFLSTSYSELYILP